MYTSSKKFKLTEMHKYHSEHIMRATHLAQLAASYEKLTTNGEMSIPDRPYSLYEGAAGMCCAWGEVLRRIDGREGAGRGMPAFDDLARSL